MRGTFLAVLGLGLVVSAARAQHGDKQGEVQHPPPASLIIPPAPVLSVREELKTFALQKGFRVEVVASDPLIRDPIAMTFGPDGRIWVVEMHGFMPDADATNEREPVASIVVLESSRGDGVMDKRTVFLDHLIMPRALALVSGGVLVAEPTHLWFCQDTRGTGVCDRKTEVAADYGNITNPEHNANGLMHALDNQIYSANYTARFRDEGNGRFRRDPTITRGQWGITQDNFGRIYYNSNSDPLRVDEVPSEYGKRNPDFAAAGSNVQLVPATLPVYPSRVTPGINRGYKTLNAEGKMYFVTAACGPVIYRGALFPREYQGEAFIAEPAGNLIKRISLTESGGALQGANAYTGTEFFTSTDERFRPVNLYNGPDGALYVVDMYRGLIQHHIYLTSYLRQQSEARGLVGGLHHGRIFRIVPEGAPSAAERWAHLPNLATVTVDGRVAALNDANGWTRDMAQQLLVEGKDPGALPGLRALVATKERVGDLGTPLGRLHALWTLEGMGALDPASVLAGLSDPDPHVCAAAIRLSERMMAPPGDPQVLAKVVSLTSRAEPTVSLQLALSLGVAASPAGDKALLSLVDKAGLQPFLADAVVSGLAGREVAFVQAIVSSGSKGTRAATTLTYCVSAVLRSGNAATIDRVLGFAADDASAPWARAAILDGVRFFLPKAPQGKRIQVFPATLPAEPKALTALAAKPDTRLGKTAQFLVGKLRWPGKAGMAASMAVPLTPAEQALFDRGKTQFAALCAACHQPNGQGLPGLAPPLIYSQWVLGDPRVLARIVLCGKAQDTLAMPGWRAALNDQAIAAVLTFIRRSWGHEASAIQPAVVSEARRATADRQDPWSDADLEDLMQELGPAKASRSAP